MNAKLVSKVVSCLGLVFIFVILISSASAEITFLNSWGSEGIGDGQFRGPYGVALSGTGQVYVADASNHRIQRFDADGNYQMQWGSEGSGNSQFNYPSRITPIRAKSTWRTEATTASSGFSIPMLGSPAQTRLLMVASGQQVLR